MLDFHLFLLFQLELQVGSVNVMLEMSDVTENTPAKSVRKRLTAGWRLRVF